MNNRWLFPAVCVVFTTALILSKQHAIWFILLLFWLWRIICLQEMKVLVISVLGIVLSGIYVFSFDQNNISKMDFQTSVVQAKIKLNTINLDGDRLRFEAFDRVYLENFIVIYQITTLEEKEYFQNHPWPEMVELKGTFEKPSDRRNFHQFDYQSFLYRKQIHYLFKADEVNFQAYSTNLLDHFNRFRFTFLSGLSKRMPHKLNEYVQMLLFSNRSDTDPETIAAFQDLGLIHLLSISGLHITFFVQHLRYLLYAIGISRKQTSYFLVIFLLFYASFSGWGVSVFRASLQAIFKEVQAYFGLSIGTLDIWSVVFVLALFLNPYLIFSLGFQLSYSLSLMFILLNQSTRYQKMSALGQNITETALVTLVSAPFLIEHFYVLQTYSLLANALFIPLFSKYILPSVIGLFLLNLFGDHTVISFLNYLFTDLINIVENGLRIVGGWPLGEVVIGRLPFIFTIVFICCIMIYLKNFDRQLFQTRIFFIVSMILTYHFWKPIDQVVMLEVGQGDSVLIQQKWGRGNILIDTGGQFDFPKEDFAIPKDPYNLSEDVIVPSLKSLGVTHLDAIIISHNDHDHVGELLELLHLFKVDTVYMTPQTYEEMGLSLENIQIVHSPSRFSAMEHARFIWPTDEKNGERNHRSLVLYGKIGNDFWLFTGDIDIDAEEKLMQEWPQLKIDQLKVAHHGSDTSTSKAFLENYQIQNALISAGRNNRYGHPDSEVMARLEREKIQSLVTSEVGAIAFQYYWGRAEAVIKTAKENEE